MCELFALSSRIATEVSISLHRFAQRGGLNDHTLDGWGLALYAGNDLRLYREPEPARDSAWLGFIEHQHRPSHCVISHIRHATRGAISLANTQPFVRELGGHIHGFAHNGRLVNVEGVVTPSTARFYPVGETDSEIAACLLLERMATRWNGTTVPSLPARLGIVSEFAAEMRELGPANFLYSDSDVLFAHGHRRMQADGSISPPGLWMLHRRCAVDPDVLAAAGVRLTETENSQELILFASVLLTAEDWRPLREGEVVAVRRGLVLT